MKKSELKKIIKQLVELGEDKEEMDFWLDVYDDFPKERQKVLAENLSMELEQLMEIEKKYATM